MAQLVVFKQFCVMRRGRRHGVSMLCLPKETTLNLSDILTEALSSVRVHAPAPSLYSPQNILKSYSKIPPISKGKRFVFE